MKESQIRRKATEIIAKQGGVSWFAPKDYFIWKFY